MVYFDEYTRDIFHSATFKELSAPSLSFVLKSNKLKIDEYEIYTAIRSWATVNAVSTSIVYTFVFSHRLRKHTHTQMHNTTSDNTTQHHTKPHNTTQHHTKPHNITQNHTTSHKTTQHHTTPHNITQNHTPSHNTTQHHTEPHNITQHHTTSHKTTCTCTLHFAVACSSPVLARFCIYSSSLDI